MDHLCQKSDASVKSQKLGEESFKSLKENLKIVQGKQFSMQHMNDAVDAEYAGSADMELEGKIKNEREDTESQHSRDSFTDEKRTRKHPASEDASADSIEVQPPTKVWKGIRYKTWGAGVMQPSTKFKKSTDREITEVSLYL